MVIPKRAIIPPSPTGSGTCPPGKQPPAKSAVCPTTSLVNHFPDYVDFQMPGTYYLYPEFDYSAQHTGDGDRHWLAALLGEQEVNMKLSPKPRIAWQWLFNTQSGDYPGSAKAEHPAPPAVAEGMGIFTGLRGPTVYYSGTTTKTLFPTSRRPPTQPYRGLTTTGYMLVMSTTSTGFGGCSNTMATSSMGGKRTSTRQRTAPTTGAKPGSAITQTNLKQATCRLCGPSSTATRS